MRIYKTFIICLVLFFFSSALPKDSSAREIVLNGFEKNPQGWEIPDWAMASKDYVAKQVSVSEYHSSEGKYSLEVESNFTGALKWEGAYVECVVDVTDWSPFNYLSLEIFLPKDAPQGLRARIILTVGEDWKWTEMNKAILLTPGEWAVINVDLTENSMGWRRFVTESFRADVRKLGVRIESNGKIVYKGPIYIDNVRLSE